MSKARWAAVVRQIELEKAQQEVVKPSAWRGLQVDEQQRMAEVAELELRRQQPTLKQQLKITRKQETARQRAQAAQEMQERYERAVVERDFRWLLAAERRAASSLRTRIRRLVGADSQQGYCELLWRQAQQARELAEVHYRELITNRINADAGNATSKDLR